MRAQHLAVLLWLGAPLSPRAAETGLVPFPVAFAGTGHAARVAMPTRLIHAYDDRLRAVDGHFYAGNRRVRIWGVNVCYASGFPSHAEAEEIAARLAASGVNGVRFHHMDAHPFPDGIWDPSDSRRLSPEALDRLDYFIDQLARHGIYANLNLHVSRSHARVLGLPEADRLPDMDKVAGLFMPPLIEAQRVYARELLGRMNRYRRLVYAEDPAVAFVEISNENSLFMWGAEGILRGLPPPYAAVLRGHYAAWLKARYGGTEAVRRAWAVGALSAGRTLLANGDMSRRDRSRGGAESWALELHGGCTARVSLAVSGLRVDIPVTDGTNWHVQVAQGGFRLKAGQYYTLRYRARADAPRSIWVGVLQSHDPWGLLGVAQTDAVGTGWVEQVIGFTATSDETNSRVCFGLGATADPVELGAVRLYPGGIEGLRTDESIEKATVRLFGSQETPARTLDRGRFLADIERGYFEGMRSYLKSELRCRALVTGTIVFGPASLYTQSGMDYLDAHAYWQHPRFPGRPWDPANWTVEQKAMFEHPDESPLFDLAASRVDGKPFTVSEYNHPAPNDAQAECVPMISTFAAAQDWDGVWLFASRFPTGEAGRARSPGFFDIAGNPAKEAFLPAGASVFRDGALASLVDARIVPIAESSRDGIQLGDLQGRFGGAMFSLAVSRESRPLQRADALRARLEVSLDGKRLETGTPMGPVRDPERSVLQWSRTNGYCALGRGALAWVGRPGVGAPGPVTLRSPSFASIMVTAMDGEPFSRTRRILVSACGRCENTGMAFSRDSRTVGIEWGHAPARVEPVDALVRMPGLASGSWTCSPVHADGSTSGRLPFDPTRPLEIRSSYRTVWYVLEREP